MIAEKYIEAKEDYSKVFDRVHHAQLIDSLQKIGLDGKHVNLIASLNCNQKAAIRIEDKLSDYNKI